MSTFAGAAYNLVRMPNPDDRRASRAVSPVPRASARLLKRPLPVTRVPGRSTIDGGAASSLGVLRQVRR